MSTSIWEDVKSMVDSGIRNRYIRLPKRSAIRRLYYTRHQFCSFQLCATWAVSGGRKKTYYWVENFRFEFFVGAKQHYSETDQNLVRCDSLVCYHMFVIPNFLCKKWVCGISIRTGKPKHWSCVGKAWMMVWDGRKNLETGEIKSKTQNLLNKSE